MKPKLWPITACALDESGGMLALCTDAGLIGLIGLLNANASRISSLQTDGSSLSTPSKRTTPRSYVKLCGKRVTPSHTIALLRSLG
ncbi:hypothetical protein CC80DRAFT_556586 [Byssothecium circinans]|uniref:Uncharacterized protein n=1 Tax=Byssothecium circinans TaxID=147558 RepID=A0A6A5T8T7_9PLEO|nr:hypothetical protein CC80DRAFT_556586 [Byssothecium circinans]